MFQNIEPLYISEVLLLDFALSCFFMDIINHIIYYNIYSK